VTAGYIEPGPRRDLYPHLDAVNVDLKAFSESFYRRVAMGRLAPVLESIEFLHAETDAWVELTTLVIPGHNDTDEELDRLTRWVVERLGPDVPLHFSAFHPDFRMTDVAPTPTATLRRARAIARSNGVHHVYLGNVRDLDGDTTWCGACGDPLIERDWYELGAYRLTDSGACPRCHEPLPGRFGPGAGTWGARSVPVRIAEPGR
jgi:pyruvate formate lyase activating enzyme